MQVNNQLLKSFIGDMDNEIGDYYLNFVICMLPGSVLYPISKKSLGILLYSFFH